MVESVFIIIGCYLFSAVLVHAAHRWNPQWQREALHYVLVTKDSEGQAELVMRAISLYAWLCGKNLRITVIDEGSRDQTLRIIGLLNESQHTPIVQSRSCRETERIIRSFHQSANVASYRKPKPHRSEIQLQSTGHKSRSSKLATGKHGDIKVIYLNRQVDRAKIPLFSNG